GGAHVGEDRVLVREGRPVGRRHGRRLAPAPHRRTRPRLRAPHGRRFHRRPDGAAHRPLQSGSGGRQPDGGGPRLRRRAGPRAVGRARDHEGRAQSRGAHGPRHGDRGGSAGAGRLHAEPQLPRSLRGLQGEARAQIRVMMPDPTAVSAFLTEAHVALAARIAEYAAREIAPRPEPADDAAARAQARDLVAGLGGAGWFAPIGSLDLRAACLVREALAAASPLADAVFALQALGTVPILLAGDPKLKDRWVPPVLAAPHRLGEIAFADCRVPASCRLGAEGEGFKLGPATLDRLRATVAAAACGMAARALAEALAHATRRRQFGRTLAEFQLVQEKLARMATDLTAARLLTYRAAWEKDRGAERVTLEAAMAKAFA